MVMKSIILWNITPCSWLKVSRRFGRTYRLHLQDRRISRALLSTEFHAGILLSLFKSEDRDDMFVRNVGWLSVEYMALYPRRQYSYTLLWFHSPFPPLCMREGMCCHHLCSANRLLTEWKFLLHSNCFRKTDWWIVKDLKGSGSEIEVTEENKVSLRVDTRIMTKRKFPPLDGNNFGLRCRDIGLSLFGDRNCSVCHKRARS
jgi:hypothetical protein